MNDHLDTPNDNVSRRQFLATAAISTTAIVAAPAILTAGKTDKPTVVGEGEHRFEVQHNCCQLPDKYTWQTTHNVAVDKDDFLYVIHEGRDNQTDHPSVFVFDPNGKFVRAFGKQFNGGGHGIEIRQEGCEQFVYLCAYKHLKTFAKLTLKGEVVWQRFAPMEAGQYPEGEDTKPKMSWGRTSFLPTNFAFLDDGGFLLADGYGTYRIHRYDKDAKWISCFGGVGKGKGTFNLPHGLWVDNRTGREKQIVVADRANHTLQYFTMEGKYVETITGFDLPANVDTWKNLMVVPELKARVTILDEKNKVVARLGDDGKRVAAAKKPRIREDESKWLNGKFVHPHDACFDSKGNIFVAEWVKTGRISKLKKLS